MSEEVRLTKATMTQMGSLEEIEVLWNPERYAVSRRSRLASAAGWGSAVESAQALVGGAEEFTTDLLLDTTRNPPARRDLRPLVDRLESWMEPAAGAALPEKVLFAWGSFRFQGILVGLDQVWVRFDGDGTPVRGWIRVVIRR
ncbi:MAG: hypothetical protein JXA90_12565 [Planctomycetes bacterium]|nr:hypothetical protein [Planctomycetota bacterium]